MRYACYKQTLCSCDSTVRMLVHLCQSQEIIKIIKMDILQLILTLFVYQKYQQEVLLTRLSAIRASMMTRIRRRRAVLEMGRRLRLRHFCQAQQLVAFAMIAAALLEGATTNRTVWRMNRRHGALFWETVLENFTEGQWHRHFRMTRPTFEFLATELRQGLEKRVTNFGLPIPHRQRLAAVIWWYATPTEYRTIAVLFGIGKSTLHYLVREVNKAIKELLMRRFISLPAGERLQETIEGFADRGFPQTAGAIDGTHIPIIAPHDNPNDYYNRKGWHSIILQAVVDHNFCFTDIYVGWPGRTHDARVLANSDIFRLAEYDQGGFLFPRETSKVINGVEVPVFLIGDPAYPLKSWLMKGFTHHGRLSRQQQNFNFRLSSARMVVENAFGRLKGRWKCLQKRIDIDVSIMPDTVTACCVLHNICELNKEHYIEEWNAENDEAQPQENPAQHDVPENIHAANATAIRTAVLSSL